MLREVERRRERWLRDRAEQAKRADAQRKAYSKKRNQIVPDASPRVEGSSSSLAPVDQHTNTATLASSYSSSEDTLLTSNVSSSAHGGIPNLAGTVANHQLGVAVGANNAADHIQNYLSSQLLSHSCPICYELMRGQERAPVLVFQCGHSFCKSCLQQYCLHGKNESLQPCPVCNQPIQSWAINKSLQSIIETFLQSRVQHLQQRQNGNPASYQHNNSNLDRIQPRGPGTEYRDTLAALDTRIRILTNQRTNALTAQQSAKVKVQAYQAAQNSLLEEKKVALEALAAAQAQLDLVQQHLLEQESKANSALQDEKGATDKVCMIDTSIADLELERDKIKLLLQATSK